VKITLRVEKKMVVTWLEVVSKVAISVSEGQIRKAGIFLS